MAEVIISPGVFQQETDQSFYNATPQVVGAALVGPTVLGVPFVPTYVTNYNQFKTLYGETFKSGSYYYEYWTSLAAKDYFANGGQTMLITRIISGSNNTIASTYASASVTASNAPSNSFVLETLAWGSQMNNVSTEVSGALPSGSAQNIRYEVAYSDTGSGVFTLLVRRGDDTAAQKNVLETWSNLSLDPQLPNYISRVIGDLKPTPDVATGVVTYTGDYANKSAFVRVKSVFPMVDSIDNNGNFKSSSYANFMPAIGSGSFNGGIVDTTASKSMYESASADNIQGFAPADYINAFRFLTDKDNYQFNVLLAPGVSLNTSAANAAITTVENRGDAVWIADAGLYGTGIAGAVNNAAPFLSNYAATYYPWVSLYSAGLGKTVWCPPSTVIGGVLAYNDSTTAEWFAPAGLNRGGIPSVVAPERRVQQTDRDTLYLGRVNPLATFPNVGVCVWGQKTLQKKPSALDRLNVRRLLIALKGFIGGIARTLVFEQNTTATRNRFLAQVNPYLSSVVQRQGLYAYKVIMDATNNTPDVIDRNQLVGQIYIQPTKTAEFVILNFNILPTGATFPA
jgi:phage tail sheath protein FI